MRISWLEPDVVRAARDALLAHHPRWASHFDGDPPAFVAPTAPAGFDPDRWPRIAEHVARAERVAQELRDHGLAVATTRFGGSRRAVELATLTAAAAQIDQLDFELLVALLACDVDELVLYGTFLAMLSAFRDTQAERAVAAYEQFSAAFTRARGRWPGWDERVAAVRDGLASFYVSCGRHDDGDDLFRARHDEDPSAVLVALAASRSFLAAGELDRAITWLERGATRADALGRAQLATRLREKQARLHARRR